MFKEPPLLEHLLLESPWAVTLLLAGVGLALLLLAIMKQKRSSAVWGLLFVAMGAGVFLLASTIKTNREKVETATRTLLANTAPFDKTVIASLLDEQVIILGSESNTDTNTGHNSPSVEPLWQIGRLAIVRGLQTACTTYPLTANLMKELEVESTSDNHARSHFVALSVASNGRARTRWLLDWKKNADGKWVVTRIQWLEEKHPIGITPASTMLRNFFEQ